MKFYEGILGVVYSLSIVLFSILFLDLGIVLELILAISLFLISCLILIPAVKIILYYVKYRRVSRNGIKIKGRVIKIRRSIVGLKDKSKYILEVLYFNPRTHKNCHAFVDYSGDNYKVNMLKNNAEIDLFIDPNNSDFVLIA